jgi:hypothetical protein
MMYLDTPIHSSSDIYGETFDGNAAVSNVMTCPPPPPPSPPVFFSNWIPLKDVRRRVIPQ